MRRESIAAHLTTDPDQGFLTNGQMLGGNVVQVSHWTLQRLARSENGTEETNEATCS